MASQDEEKRFQIYGLDELIDEASLREESAHTESDPKGHNDSGTDLDPFFNEDEVGHQLISRDTLFSEAVCALREQDDISDDGSLIVEPDDSLPLDLTTRHFDDVYSDGQIFPEEPRRPNICERKPLELARPMWRPDPDPPSERDYQLDPLEGSVIRAFAEAWDMNLHFDPNARNFDIDSETRLGKADEDPEAAPEETDDQNVDESSSSGGLRQTSFVDSTTGLICVLYLPDDEFMEGDRFLGDRGKRPKCGRYPLKGSKQKESKSPDLLDTLSQISSDSDSTDGNNED